MKSCGAAAQPPRWTIRLTYRGTEGEKSESYLFISREILFQLALLLPFHKTETPLQVLTVSLTDLYKDVVLHEKIVGEEAGKGTVV